MTVSTILLVLAFLALIVRTAVAADGDFVVQPVEGWLIAVVLLALISIYGRYRSAKNNSARVRSVARSEH